MKASFFAVMLLIVLAPAAFAASTAVDQWLIKNGCNSCHARKSSDAFDTKTSLPDCNSCHVRLGVALYQHAPELTFTRSYQGKLEPIYSAKELSDFLRHPVKIRPLGLGEMSPVTEERIRSLLDLLVKEDLLKAQKLDKAHFDQLQSVPNKKPDQMRHKLLLGTRLYERVLNEGLAKSCRHCHSSSSHAQEELLQVFGRAPKLFFLESNGKTISIALGSRPALNPGPDCSDSLLLQHLEERRMEGVGQGTALLGMPLSVAPLPADLISDIRLWSAQGCPSPQGLLCSPCS